MGLAPVPLLFLAGALLDDESEIIIFDWRRDQKSWQLCDTIDDGKRFEEPNFSQLANSESVILAVSVSYQIDINQVQDTLGPALPLLTMSCKNVEPDNHWSIQKQIALTSQFVKVLASLASRGVKTVHLFLAAPASLSIRLGMALDQRNMPETIVYQYERSAQPPFPWGVAIPSHGKPKAHIVKPERVG